jgi:aminopeptidase
MDSEELERYSRLVLEVGANLQDGQDLAINAQIEHAPLARALAEEGYAQGAHYVDIWYWEPHAKRSRIRHAAEDTLGWIPPWLDQRYDYLSKQNAATVMIAGDPEPDLLADADPRRVGLDRLPALASRYRAQMRGDVNWTIAPYPTAGWAQVAFGEPDVDRLWGLLRSFLRLDRPNPVAAWRDHIDTLTGRARRLTEAKLDALHYKGPGTDLTVGLLTDARWEAAELQSKTGVVHRPNLPTEEVFTTPDRARAEGVIRSTRPLALAGTVVRDLVMTLEDGHIVEVGASSGADVVRGELDADEGSRSLGEVALVDGTSPIGQSGVVFFNTLLDENATCHIAYGAGIPSVLEGGNAMSKRALAKGGVNQSVVHTDFMVGGPELAVDGITEDGRRVPILRDDVWQL